jgi:Tol biopolymer transport system component
MPNQVDLSPDGRNVVYDQPQRSGADERDVWLLDVASGTTRAIVAHGADDTAPVFTPDGSGVVFSSTRTGGIGLWLQRVVDGRPEGEPVRLGQNVGPYSPLGFTSSGALFYLTVGGLVDVFVADVDLAQGQVGEPRKVEGGRFVGSNLHSSWSPDSRRLAFVSRREEVGGPRTQTLVIHDVPTGEATELHPALERMSWSAWSPDATTLLLRGTGRVGDDPRSRQTLWLVDTATAATRAVMPPGEPDTIFSPRWKPDGKAVYFVRNRQMVERAIETGDERVVVEGAGNDIEVSPDGRRVAFVQRSSAGSTVVVSPLDRGARAPVAEYPASYYVVTVGWTPDGSEVVFTVRDNTFLQGRTGEELASARWLTEVWAARADGSARRRLGQVTAVNARTFRLSPDGRRLSFEAGFFRWAYWAMEGFLPPALRTARSKTANAGRQQP